MRGNFLHYISVKVRRASARFLGNIRAIAGYHLVRISVISVPNGSGTMGLFQHSNKFICELDSLRGGRPRCLGVSLVAFLKLRGATARTSVLRTMGATLSRGRAMSARMSGTVLRKCMRGRRHRGFILVTGDGGTTFVTCISARHGTRRPRVGGLLRSTSKRKGVLDCRAKMCGHVNTRVNIGALGRLLSALHPTVGPASFVGQAGSHAG